MTSAPPSVRPRVVEETHASRSLAPDFVVFGLTSHDNDTHNGCAARKCGAGALIDNIEDLLDKQRAVAKKTTFLVVTAPHKKNSTNSKLKDHEAASLCDYQPLSQGVKLCGRRDRFGFFLTRLILLASLRRASKKSC